MALERELETGMRIEPKRNSWRHDCTGGFSLLELIVVLLVTLILAAIAIPNLQSMMAAYRMTTAVRSVSSQIALARMRGASDFTRAQVNFNTAANTYQVEVWNKGSSAFVVEGGTFNLPTRVTFGYGGITAPAGSQTSIAQTIPIAFNSRGIPIDSLGNPISTAAIYLGDAAGNRYFAVSVTLSGQIQTWQYLGGGWVKF